MNYVFLYMVHFQVWPTVSRSELEMTRRSSEIWVGFWRMHFANSPKAFQGRILRSNRSPVDGPRLVDSSPSMWSTAWAGLNWPSVTSVQSSPSEQLIFCDILSILWHVRCLLVWQPIEAGIRLSSKFHKHRNIKHTTQNNATQEHVWRPHDFY